MDNLSALRINFEGVEEAGTGNQRLKPGVYDSLTVSEVTFGTSTNKGTPYAEVTVTDGQGTYAESFYLTHKALGRLKYFLVQLGVDSTLVNSDINAEQLRKAMMGRSFHGKISGREFIGKNNQISVGSQFEYTGFAQPINEENTLVFDPNRDIERMDVGSSNNHMSSSGLVDLSTDSGTDDLSAILGG